MGEILRWTFFWKTIFDWVKAKHKSPEKMLFSKEKEFKNMTEKMIRLENGLTNEMNICRIFYFRFLMLIRRKEKKTANQTHR